MGSKSVVMSVSDEVGRGDFSGVEPGDRGRLDRDVPPEKLGDPVDFFRDVLFGGDAWTEGDALRGGESVSLGKFSLSSSCPVTLAGVTVE